MKATARVNFINSAQPTPPLFFNSKLSQITLDLNLQHKTVILLPLSSPPLPPPHQHHFIFNYRLYLLQEDLISSEIPTKEYEILKTAQLLQFLSALEDYRT